MRAWRLDGVEPRNGQMVSIQAQPCRVGWRVGQGEPGVLMFEERISPIRLSAHLRVPRPSSRLRIHFSWV